MPRVNPRSFESTKLDKGSFEHDSTHPLLPARAPDGGFHAGTVFVRPASPARGRVHGDRDRTGTAKGLQKIRPDMVVNPVEARD